MMIASLNALLEALRQFRLLDPAQLAELEANPGRFLDSKSLAGELIRRGWVTPFQANQLLNGKGQDLVIGSYILMERLGEGGMGQVFKARHRTLGRIAAIKLIRKERLDNPRAVKRFQREVRSAAALSHPNIVLAYDADEIAGTHFMVMEYIDGAIDLAKLVKRSGPLPIDRACEYIRQAALGLQHAHESGMVHRDIKPANLLAAEGGKSIKVLDMGLARLDQPSEDEEKSTTMTQEGAFMGTPDYIAPEQALDTHTVDIRADLYSLGCTFYYLLTGRVPFPGGTLLQKLNKHQSAEPAPIEQFREEAPAAVVAIVRKLMAKRPEDRYQTPAELAAALTALCEAGIEAGSVTGGPTLIVERSGDSESVKEVKRDTLISACSYIEKRDDTIALDPVVRPRHGLGFSPHWLWFGLVGAVVLCVIPGGCFLFKKRGVSPPPRPGPVIPVKKPQAKKELDPLAQAKALLGGTWYYIGPFDNRDMIGFDTAYPPEKEINLEAVYPGKDEQPVQWLEFKDFQLDFLLSFLPLFKEGSEREHACIYLYRAMDTAEDMTVPVSLGSDDTLSVWLNGERLLHKPVLRQLRPGDDIVMLRLKAGKNHLLVKICQKTGAWGFYIAPLHLTDLPLFMQPTYEAWLKQVEAQPPDAQFDAVLAKLKELNPRFDGDVKSKKENGIVTELSFTTDVISDISPLRALKGLHTLTCAGTGFASSGFVADLTPLIGLNLVSLNCGSNKIADLTPIKGMKLKKLHLHANRVADLSPLKGMELTNLSCRGNLITDLAPLQGMPLTSLECNYNQIGDLSPLAQMQLTHVNCELTKVADLSPLRNHPLTYLNCAGTPVADLSPLPDSLTRLHFYSTQVKDLSPLARMKLSEVTFTPAIITQGLDVLRGMSSLRTIGVSWQGDKRWPPAQFWSRLENGEFDRKDP